MISLNHVGDIGDGQTKTKTYEFLEKVQCSKGGRGGYLWRFANPSIRPKMKLSSSIRTNFSPLDGGPLALTFAYWVHLLLRTSEQLSERKSAQHRVSHNLTTHVRPNLHIWPFNPSSISWVEWSNRGWRPTVGQYIADTGVLLVE